MTVYLLMFTDIDEDCDETFDSVEGVYTYEGMKKKLKEFSSQGRRWSENITLDDEECSNNYMKRLGYWIDKCEVID